MPTESRRRSADDRPLFARFLWRGLLNALSEWDPRWRERIGFDRPRRPVRSAESGPPISNREAFEAFAVALLSGNTRWERVERVLPALGEPFDGFDPAVFADRTDQWIKEKVVPWFRERGAGAPRLSIGLLRLREAAGVLAGGGGHGSAAEFIRAAFDEAGGSPERVALLLGTAKRWKLPGFGIALAAEALRNLGYDLCKPDRHVLRAVSSWKLVEFARWTEKGPFTAPQAKPDELLATMLSVRLLAEANEVAGTKANTAIWTAGAVSGARLTNDELREIGGSANPGR